jgi:4-hydroxythreonine-4-phosphate dehydrogenase
LQCDRLGVQLQWARIPHDSSRLDDPVRSPILVRDFAYPESLRTIEAQPTIAGGQLSKQLVETAIKDAMRAPDDPMHIDAIVTGPISKQAWAMAGSRFPGHTELLAHRTRAKRHAMLFESKQLTVVLATAHIPLMDLRNILTIGRVFDPIDLGAAWCRGMGIRNPRVAVCGLNPHAGEDGLLGDEDKRIITPAIEMACNAGIDTHGPFPADTIFRSAAAGDWDLVVAMYHDQGLIPVKLLGFHDAVNVTTGLPFIRTSPDHGTGYDIASHSFADPSSMLAAITLAARQASVAVLSGN